MPRRAQFIRGNNERILLEWEAFATRFGDSLPIVRTNVDLRRIVIDVAAEVGTRYPDSSGQVRIGPNERDLRGQWDGDRLAQALTEKIVTGHGAASR